MELQILMYFMAPFLMNIRAAQLPYKSKSTADVTEGIVIECNSNEIIVAIDIKSGIFNGMIYPEGLSKNSSCMTEFYHQISPLYYRLPLRSCNTMSTVLINGNVEYFNNIVVQPHRKLVTNQGRGFHIRCRYQTRDKIVTNDVNVREMEPSSVMATAPMPACTMKILSGDEHQNEVAENVKIGDPLTLIVSIDSQTVYGLKVSDCLVRDGLGWGEQRLIDSDGCPVDHEIMGMFEYSPNQTTALVHFQAHKFPYTASVYYQCNVRLCYKSDNGCDDVPPGCRLNSENRRRKRNNDEESPAMIEVYSGLYVNEANDLLRPDEHDLVSREYVDELGNICISQRHFAIGISIAGLILMIMVVTAFLILLTRRRSRKYVSPTGSSIYSGPYTNTAYSHSS